MTRRVVMLWRSRLSLAANAVPISSFEPIANMYAFGEGRARHACGLNLR